MWILSSRKSVHYNQVKLCRYNCFVYGRWLVMLASFFSSCKSLQSSSFLSESFVHTSYYHIRKRKVPTTIESNYDPYNRFVHQSLINYGSFFFFFKLEIDALVKSSFVGVSREYIDKKKSKQCILYSSQIMVDSICFVHGSCYCWQVLCIFSICKSALQSSFIVVKECTLQSSQLMGDKIASCTAVGW